MGLHISREVLRRVGYDLTLIDNEDEKGATFAISPTPPTVEGTSENE